jgi:hypothetical protein
VSPKSTVLNTTSFEHTKQTVVATLKSHSHNSMSALHHIISATLTLHNAILTGDAVSLRNAHTCLDVFKSKDPEENELLLSVQDAIKVQLSKLPPSP